MNRNVHSEFWATRPGLVRHGIVKLHVLLICCITSAMASVDFAVKCLTTSSPEIEAYFSPNGGCTDAIVNQIGQAKETIEIQAYLFESDRIAKALLAAADRGVQIRAILDSWNERDKYSVANTLNNAAIPTYIDAEHATSHNKIMIIDGQTLITGSFNFTTTAEEKNAENLLVIRHDATLLHKYEENFERHLAHSYGYGS